MPEPLPPPGWYPDTFDAHKQRYWDGARWTEHHRAAPVWTPFAPGEASPRPDEALRWWQAWWAIVPGLLICLPIGLIGLWMRPGLSTRLRWIVTGISTVILLLAMAPSLGSDPGAGDSAGTAATPAADTSAPVPSAPVPSVAPSSPAAPPRVQAPRVHGKSRSDAGDELAAVGLVVGQVVRRPSRQPVGTVLKQSPPPGHRLAPGTAVDLIIAAPLPRVPDLAGLRPAQARALLRRAGFMIVTHTRAVSSGRDGVVLTQTPASGVAEPPGTTVTVVVSDVHAPAVAQPSCTPGYSPCLPPASDYDCAGGSGNGPEYVYGVEHVTGSDPYGLDADGDGYGCE